MEEWREIKRTNGKYFVSNTGKIKSKKGILKGVLNDRGYLIVTFYINGKGKKERVHRLVAEHFIENNGKPEVNHIDGNKTNNNAENLEYLTKIQNLEHAHRIGLYNKKGENHHMSKIDDITALTILTFKNKISARKLSEKYNVGCSTIANIWSGRGWRHIQVLN